MFKAARRHITDDGHVRVVSALYEYVATICTASLYTPRIVGPAKMLNAESISFLLLSLLISRFVRLQVFS